MRIRARLVVAFVVMSIQLMVGFDVALAVPAITAAQTDAVPGTHIVVEKQTNPDGATQSFDFTASYDGDGFSLSDGQQNDSGDLEPGQYSVSETAPTGWKLVSVVCDSSNGGTEDFGAIDLEAGETVTCVFTNRKQVSITIVKDATPADGTNFTFLTTIPLHSLFFLDDAAVDDNDGITDTFTTFIDPGTYTIIESVLAGWTLTGIACTTSDPNTGVTTVNNVVFFVASVGENVNCTFTNVKRGTVTVVKDAVEATGQDFTINLDGDVTGTATVDDAVPDDNDGIDSDFTWSLLPGDYTLSETIPAAWNLNDLTCVTDDSNEAVVVTTNLATINLDAGENVTCTFTNERKKVTITVIKDATPADGTNFTFLTTIPLHSLFFLDDAAVDDNDGITDTFTTQVFPGSYTILESVPGGWNVSIVCTSSDPATGMTVVNNVAFFVGGGDETVTCTFTNVKRGNITIVKDATPEDGTDFSFTGDLGNFQLDDDADGTLPNQRTFNVQPGTYGVSEVVPDDWNLASATCTDGSPASAIDVSAGENVTCTFVNTNASQPTLTTQASANVQLGGAISDTATLSDGSQPTGTITFTLFGPDNAGCAGAPVFTSTVPVAGNGQYSSALFTPTSAGTYRWQASYSGDANNQTAGPTSCSDPAEAVTVTQTPPPSYQAGNSFSVFGTQDSRAVTVADVPNRILVFVFSGKLGGDSLSSVTYGGVPMPLLAARSQGSVRLEIHYLVAPAAGTAQLAWTKSGASQNVVWGFSVYQGVNQTTPWGTPASAGATGAAPGPKSVLVDAAGGDLVVDGAVFNGGATGSGPAAAGGQAQRFSRNKSTTQGGSSDKLASASPVTMAWSPAAGSGNSFDWALIGAPLKPVAPPPGGKLNSTTATQSSTTAGDVAPGSSVSDTATVGGGGPTPTGTVTFFLCQPATVTANGGNCNSGGTQVGSAKTLNGAGQATSDPTTNTATDGTYCWRAEYSGDANYNPSVDGGPTNECFTVATPPGGGPIAFVAANSYSKFGTSDSQPVTVPGATNRILVFQFAGKLGGDSLTSVTYGGVPLTLLAARSQGSVRLEIRYLVSPPAGTQQLAWTKSGASQNVTWGWSIYSGVNQATPFGAAVQNGATGDSAGAKSVVVPASSGDVVVDAVVFNSGGVPAAGPTAGGGQTARWSRRQSTTQGGSSDKPGTASTTMSWTPAAGSGSTLDWALIGAPLKTA